MSMHLLLCTAITKKGGTIRGYLRDRTGRSRGIRSFNFTSKGLVGDAVKVKCGEEQQFPLLDLSAGNYVIQTSQGASRKSVNGMWEWSRRRRPIMATMMLRVNLQSNVHKNGGWTRTQTVAERIYIVPNI